MGQSGPPARSTNSAETPSASVNYPRTVEPANLGARSAQHGGSLLQATLSTSPDPHKAPLSAVSFVAVPEPQPKLVKKHDLVTIIIRESTEFASDGTTDLKKEADVAASVQEWIKVKKFLTDFQLQGGGEGATPPSIKMSGSRNFKGEATVDQTDTFTTRLTAEVVDVKPNGTFAIQARRKMKHNEEQQEMIVTGVCRAADLSLDNTLLSTQVHDLSIETNHKGAVRDTTKRGLVPKLLDFLNPF
jgi:flagellar L-ring protein precursor FlgH